MKRFTSRFFSGLVPWLVRGACEVRKRREK